MYEIGQVYTFDGVERKVIGMDGPYPVTTTDLGREPERPAGAAHEALLRARIRAELEEVFSLRSEAEQVEACRGLLALLPLEKCNKEELLSVAFYLSREIKTEGGQEPAKAEIISTILGA